MNDFYCLDISFPGVDFDSFLPHCEKSKPSHHAHLYSNKEKIEIKIFYEPITRFGWKLMAWAEKIDSSKFCTYLELSIESKNSRLQRIDLTESKLIEIDEGTKEGDFELAHIRIDVAKFYFVPDETKINTAEFYLNDTGFSLVAQYYSPILGYDGKFEIRRMRGMDDYYQFEKSEFRPEFDFNIDGDKYNKEEKIIKKPKIQFKYNENITEEEAIKYADIFRLLASFYNHEPVDFTLSRIHLKQNTITIRKIQNTDIPNPDGGFNAFNLYWDFHKFMQSDWQQHALKNYKKLSKVIEMFNQALIVGGSSEFLIRFNIIEICRGGNRKEDEFISILDKEEKNKKYVEALAMLLKTVNTEDHSDFITKWEGVVKDLVYKPMKSPFITFLESQNLAPLKFPIGVDAIFKIRNSITHGSLKRVKHEQLEKANILLYRITGILILNLLGIDQWQFDMELK